MTFSIDTVVHKTLNTVHITNGIIYVVSLILNSIWLIICMKLCHRVALRKIQS